MARISEIDWSVEAIQNDTECSSGKKSYANQKAVRSAMSRMIGRKQNSGHGKLGVYKCRECGEFHLGNWQRERIE